MFKSKLRLQIRIDDFRELQDKRNLSSKEQNEKLALDSLDFYTYTTKVLLNDLSNIIIASNGSRTWRFLVTYKNMLRAIESLGIEISYGIVFIGNGALSPDDYANFIETHFLCQEYMLQVEHLLSHLVFNSGNPIHKRGWSAFNLLSDRIRDLVFEDQRTYLYKVKRKLVFKITSTAKQVLGNCERMVLANFIGNNNILNNIMSEE